MTSTGMSGMIWSLLHEEVWSSCARRYYYIYVEPARPPGSPLPMAPQGWLERVIHDAAAMAVWGLRRKEPVSLRRLSQAVERRMRAEWKANRDRRPGQLLPQVQWDGRHAPALELNDAEFPPSTLDRHLAQAGRCLEALYTSPEFERLARSPGSIQTVAQIKRIPFGDVQIELEIDVESLEPNGEVVLLDWQVDADEKAPAQTRTRREILAWYSMRLYEIDEVSVLELDLLTGRRELERVTLASADNARWEVRQHIDDMHRALELTSARSAEAFDWTSDHQHCRSCAFRKQCPAGRVP